MERRQEDQSKKIATYIPIDITPVKKRFCNVCNGELLKDYSCGKCGIFYQPEQARHELVIRGLDGKEPGLSTTTIPIASVDTTPPMKKQKMGSDFEALSKQGFKFTSYTESNT